MKGVREEGEDEDCQEDASVSEVRVEWHLISFSSEPDIRLNVT